MTNRLTNFKNNWYIWLFPLIALLISAGLFVDYFRQRGPMIRISFHDASSLQPEKTRVRFRGVTIGMVTKVTLSQDNKDVVAHIRLQREAKQFAVEGTKFWVVTPKVNMQGVSGLETIFEGTYIAVLPGPTINPPNYDFKGSANTETSETLEDSVAYYLETTQADSVSVGNPVLFRGLKIGSITNVELSKTSQLVIATINVQKKFVKLIRTNTSFWRKSAVQAKLGLFNSELNISSLDSLISGGIECFTPDKVGPIANANSTFGLYSGPPKGWEKWNPVLDFK
jgi:paraquat-inducible protein B